MTDNALTLKHGDEYVVFYKGGPYDGQTDRRISTDGSWDTELIVLAGVNGIEGQVVYDSPVPKKVGDQVQVHYTWAPDAGEDFGDPDELADV